MSTVDRTYQAEPQPLSSDNPMGNSPWSQYTSETIKKKKNDNKTQDILNSDLITLKVHCFY